VIIVYEHNLDTLSNIQLIIYKLIWKKKFLFQGILNKLLEALDENINVFGYCVWSFIDTLEFTFGYW